MSRRALRRLRGEQRGQEEPGLGQLGLDPGPEADGDGLSPPPSAAGSRPRRTARTGVSNRFELVRGDRAGGRVRVRGDRGEWLGGGSWGGGSW